MNRFDLDNLKKSFAPFAGRPVSMSRNTHYVDNKPVATVYEPALPKDSVLQALEDLAQQSGLQCRLICPDQMQTMDFNPQRLNVHIEQMSNGTWCIDRIVTDDSRVIASRMTQVTAKDFQLDEKIAVRKPLKIRKPAV